MAGDDVACGDDLERRAALQIEPLRERVGQRDARCPGVDQGLDGHAVDGPGTTSCSLGSWFVTPLFSRAFLVHHLAQVAYGFPAYLVPEFEQCHLHSNWHPWLYGVLPDTILNLPTPAVR